ncbi:hypothetical protein B0H16DRAFT_1552340 [Mycena metata]|uniref:Uncharacterized protein n=1 Tax=Mycena metata TaxID=1033252 RepID=A0AAD7ITR8_9AGAR|nr:hypothetical protein B0H16DRAFT_1552340 [Mycena metata]
MPHPQYNALGRRASMSKDSGKIHSNDQIAELEEHFRTQFQTTERSRADCPQTTALPLALAMSRMSLPSPEIPGLPSDWWHNDTDIRIISGPGDLWSGNRIPFVPDHGRCIIGISMKQARLGVGMFHGGTVLSRIIHPMLFHVPHPMLSIQWPGYCAFQDKYNGPQPLNIQQPLQLHETTTLAQLGQQVAEYFFEFSQLYRRYCNTRDPKALLLGPGGINFNRLRLVKLWTCDHGLSWIAEVAVVEDYVQY